MAEGIGDTGAGAGRMAGRAIRSLLSMVDRGGRANWQALTESIAGPGERLEEPALRRMEGLLGGELDGVRVHSGPQVESLASYLGAEAFTFGSRVFAPSGTLRPDTARGAGLLAHELTHVVQQTGSLRSAERGSKRSGPRAQAVAPKIQLAAEEGSPATSGAAEAEARNVEQVAQQTEEAGERKGGTVPDIDLLAERVYRLMKQDLMLEKERRGSPQP
jgi:hypothetical protein